MKCFIQTKGKSVFTCEDGFKENERMNLGVKFVLFFQGIWRWKWINLEIKFVKIYEWFDLCDKLKKLLNKM